MKKSQHISVTLFPVLIIFFALFSVTDHNFLKISEVRSEDTFIDRVKSSVSVSSSENLTYNPISLSYSSYFGGSTHEGWSQIASDVNGDLIFVTSTESDDYPLMNEIQENRSSTDDMDDLVITKFDSEMSIQFTTYYGGNGHDQVSGVEIDSDNNIIIAGSTTSTDFPFTNETNSNKANDSEADLFLLKISPDGQTVLFSSYIAGLSPYWDVSLVLDNQDNIILCGSTNSSSFPIVNAFQSENSSAIDSFIMKLNSDGDILFSTYIGGDSPDIISSCTTDNNGNILFTGFTNSSDFPLVNPVQSDSSNGTWDYFVGRLSSDGQTLEFSSLLGGTLDWGVSGAVTVDSVGNIIVGGTTTGNNFPLVGANHSEYYGVELEAFITKFTSNGEILFSTRYGGNDLDLVSSLAVDTDNNIYVVGCTFSVDFPVTPNYYREQRIWWDAFFTKFTANGSLILLNSCMGGGDSDLASDMLLIPTSSGEISIMFTGITRSMDFPTFNAYRGTKVDMSEWDNYICSFKVEDITTTTTSNSSSGFGAIVVIASILAIFLIQYPKRRKKLI